MIGCKIRRGPKEKIKLGRGGGVYQVPEHTMTIRIPKEKFKMGVALTRNERKQRSGGRLIR